MDYRRDATLWFSIVLFVFFLFFVICVVQKRIEQFLVSLFDTRDEELLQVCCCYLAS